MIFESSISKEKSHKLVEFSENTYSAVHLLLRIETTISKN